MQIRLFFKLVSEPLFLHKRSVFVSPYQNYPPPLHTYPLLPNTKHTTLLLQNNFSKKKIPAVKYIYVAVNPADLAWSSHCVFFLFGTNVSSLYIVQAVLLDIRQRDRFLKSFFSGGRFFSHSWISKNRLLYFYFFV